MKPIRPNRYHFPARDRAEELPSRIRQIARNVPRMRKEDLARELYRCAAAAQEHVLGMSTRLTIQERLAEKHEYALDDARREAMRGFASATFCDGDVFNPNGFFVYLLWGANPERPLYVGQSTNVFSRVGTHMDNPRRRPSIRDVQFIRCHNAVTMMELESALILKFDPPWNIKGVPSWRAAG